MEQFVQISFATKNSVLAKLLEPFQFDKGEYSLYERSLEVEGEEVWFVDNYYGNKTLYTPNINKDIILEGASFASWLIKIVSANDCFPPSLVNLLKNNMEAVDKSEVSSTIQYFGADPECYSSCWYYEETRNNGYSEILFVDSDLWDEWAANYRDTERCFADYDAITYPVGERIIEGLFGNKKAWQNEEYYEERKLLIKYGQKKKKIFIPKTYSDVTVQKGKPGERVATILDVYKNGASFLIAVSLFKTISKGDKLLTKDKNGNNVSFTVDHIETAQKILESVDPGSEKMIALATKDCNSRPAKGNDVIMTN